MQWGRTKTHKQISKCAKIQFAHHRNQFCNIKIQNYNIITHGRNSKMPSILSLPKIAGSGYEIGFGIWISVKRCGDVVSPLSVVLLLCLRNQNLPLRQRTVAVASVIFNTETIQTTFNSRRAGAFTRNVESYCTV
jgi:hypothetical protein